MLVSLVTMLMNVKNLHVTEMPLVKIQLDLIRALVTMVSKQVERPVLTSTSVLLVWTGAILTLHV